MHTYILHPNDFAERKRRFSVWFLRGSAVMAFLLFGINALLLFLPSNRISPGISLQNVDVGWLSREEATKKLQKTLPVLPTETVTVTWEDKTWTETTTNLGESWKIEEAINAALSTSSKKSPLDRWLARWDSLLKQPKNSVVKELDTYKVEQWMQTLAKEVNVAGERPRFVEKNGKVTLETGKLGQEVVLEEMIPLLVTRGDKTTFELSVAPINPPLSADGLIRADKRRTAWAGKELRFLGEPTDRAITIPTAKILPFLSLPEGFHTPTLENDLKNALNGWEREPQDAQWELSEDGNKLTTFVPDKTGRTFNWPELTKTVVQKLGELEQSSSRSAEIIVTFVEKKPNKTLKELNDLGVEERIGYGVSSYSHSIPNRIFNVGLTASRVNLTLVKPGEEFSFNKTVGDISRATGYKTAYVIKDGITQLGDGGGVCQVSTTVFRAALNAGFPITRWKAHSYRVGYYEQNSQPGFDATVYSPSTDFRFLNDTNHAIVVTTQADAQNQHMVVEIWGKSDGRQSTISDYSLGNQRPAPPTLFVEDPTLPRGVRKQIDWSAPGATTKFTYTVKNQDGTERFKRQFVSNFQPWRAVYLVGTL